MSPFRLILFIFVFSVSVSSCYYDVEEELYPAGCNIDSVGFAADIFPIINQNCLICHSDAANLGNVSLADYGKVKQYVDSQALLGSIRHESGYSPMPQGQAKLSKCDIEKIEKWVSEGAKNN